MGLLVGCGMWSKMGGAVCDSYDGWRVVSGGCRPAKCAGMGLRGAEWCDVGINVGMGVWGDVVQCGVGPCGVV